MNRLVAIFDTSSAAEDVIDFALELKDTGAYQVVFCLPQSLSPFPMVEAFGGQKPRAEHYNYYEILEEILLQNEELTPITRQRMIAKCRRAQSRIKVIFDTLAMEEVLVKESEFSDLVIMGYDTLHSLDDKSRLAWLIQNLKSPMVVVPSQSKTVDNILLIYDGSPSSMLAIKHFGQIMGNTFNQKQYFLISFFDNLVNPEQEQLMMDYIRLHLPNIGYLRLENIHDPAFRLFVENTPNLLMVGGKDQETITNQLFSHEDAFIPQHSVFLTRD